MELAYYFPKYFKNESEEIANNRLLLNEGHAILDDIINPSEETKKRREFATKQYLRNHKPRIWNINLPDNSEIRFETSFNQLLISVCSELNLNSSTLTTFEFYNALSLLEKRANND